ncbi:MAG: zinc ribbon domain-containing protein [Archangiaceae bacterium]|nr:zinc ribbon domain-containing protein [Archangiaceae bacterium]
MPLYEYSCPKCGDFEVLQRITEPALKRHETCGKPVVRKVSVSSFQLKGGGWYADGYGSSSKSSKSSSD